MNINELDKYIIDIKNRINNEFYNRRTSSVGGLNNIEKIEFRQDPAIGYPIQSEHINKLSSRLLEVND